MLKDVSGFALQKTISDFGAREQNVALKYCLIHDIPYQHIGSNTFKIPEGYIPIGSVEWILKILGKDITPDYYPDFLKPYLYRKVWIADKWPIEGGVFVKPADRYKRFTGFTTISGYTKKKSGKIYCSEYMLFENEWRYYISNGEVLCGEWYWNHDKDNDMEPIPAPKLDVEFPTGWCGAVDFGSIKGGKLALIEAQHPFAIGWYGDHEKDKLYLKFIVDGWKYLNKLLL